MKLYLVRHSETNYNVEGLCNSDPSVDVHLTRLGIEQSVQLANELKTADYEAVFISQLPRTRQTAEIINQHHQKPLIVNPLLNDNQTGFENRPAAEWRAALDGTSDPWNAVFNDGESLFHCADRIGEFLDELDQTDYNSVLVVTHRFPTQAIYAYLKDRTIDEAYEYNLAQGTFALFEY